MKVLIDGRPIRTPVSGSAVFVINLSQALISLGVDVTLYLQSNKGRNAELKNVTGIKSVITDGSKLLENILSEISIRNSALEKHRNSIVHETYFSNLPLDCVRKIATIHDVIPLDFPSWFSWKNSFFAKRNFLRQSKECKHIVFSSEYTRQRALNFCNKDISTSVIHLAASEQVQMAIGSHSGLENISLQSTKKNGFILMVGNIEPRKNIPLVAKGLSILNKRIGLSLDLVIAGKANYKHSDIVSQASSNLGKNIVCLGFVNEQRKIDLYKKCACHVFASKYEGFGLPVIEGLIIGSPTVIAQNSSLIEITPDPSFGFCADDAEDLADAMERNLYLSPHSSKLVDTKALSNYYSWSRVAKDYHAVYGAIE
jgi:glycosyltransferase involved in cell wall biosynthesis